jgi:hypothetical protein
MRCGHEGCLCTTEAEEAYCGDHCRDHARAGAEHEAHVCGCGHEACQEIGG